MHGTDKWILSSDIGCVFIGMEGAIHAYKILQEPQLKEVIDEMLAKLRQIDVLAIRAQTHATLTAARGLVRYAGITGDESYLTWAEDLWAIYKEHGMTEAHGNYNWFNRFDTWTEPCAIVDSYMLAVQLWMNTENPVYKEDAELIYYNGLAHGQRSNGGFGTDNCPGLAIADDSLAARSYEAHWCCTMRGGEGLGSAVRYAAFTKADTVYVPFLHECKIALETADGNFAFAEQTAYPFGNEAVFTITDNEAGQMTIKFPHMSWMNEPELSYNGETVDAVDEEDFLSLSADFETGDVIRLAFKFEQHREQPINKANTSASQYKIYSVMHLKTPKSLA